MSRNRRFGVRAAGHFSSLHLRSLSHSAPSLLSLWSGQAFLPRLRARATPRVCQTRGGGVSDCASQSPATSDQAGSLSRPPRQVPWSES